MATLSVQFRDENLTLYFDLVGQTSQLTAPMDVSHRTLGFSEMDIISMSRPGQNIVGTPLIPAAHLV